MAGEHSIAPRTIIGAQTEVVRRSMYHDGSRQLQAEFDTQRLADRHEAQFLVKVSVREVFPNCPRYIHRLSLAERSKFVPHEGVATPIPGWKTTDWARDVLARNDPARDAPKPG